MSEERKWTAMQRLAIQTTGKTLLVSAAAGSGKTATLTERIIRSILNTDNPVGIEDMLVVTFTRLAAAELRDRISAALKNAIRENPGNVRLERQLHLLPAAKICTIDAYCTELLRANCERFDVSPTFRVPDEAEISLLSENLLGGLFAEIYAGRMPEVATAEEMFSLADCLTDTGRQNDLAQVIFRLYSSTLSAEEGVGALTPLIEEYEPTRITSVESCGFGRYCMDRIGSLVGHYLPIFESVLAEIESRGEDKPARLADQVEATCELLRSLKDAGSYNRIRELLGSMHFETAVSVRDKTLPPTTALRNGLKGELCELYESFFIYSEEDWRVAYQGLYSILSVLLRVIRKFDTLLTEEKTRRGICEFSDIERYAYKCLWQDGELTDIAHSERAKYRAVYIDEYQDVNSLQNRIFEAISKPDNRFMVGDIKQSIYRFRSANPEIFASMKRSYPQINEAEGDRATVFMSDNFRCDRGIIDFVNTVFDRVFGMVADSIGYVPEDRLSFGKQYQGGTEPPYRKPELCLIDGSSLRAESKRGGVELDDKYLSAALVAEKISELLGGERKNNGEPILPGDIAIIMRKAKDRAYRYKEELEKLGIPAQVAEETRFFLSPESQLALCLLNAIDNPRKDIYLAGLMMSPLYGFTPDEMSLIRTAKGDSLYDSLRSYTEAVGYAKGASFISALERYRLLAEGMPTDRLIMRLYRETGLLALAARWGVKDSLLMLYEYARGFENSSLCGLYNFINYLNNITERKNALDKRETPKAQNAVSIITAHGSKGLEFPVVFFVGGEDPFGNRQRGAVPRFEYEEGFGIGMYLRTPGGLSLVQNPTKAVILDYRKRHMVEEEARVLYVVLTRARERLYIVGTPTKKLSDFTAECDFHRDYLSRHSIYNIKSPLSLMLAATPIETVSPERFVEQLPPIFTLTGADMSEKRNTPGDIDLQASDTEPTAASASDTSDTEPRSLSDILIERFDYTYPKRHLTRLPKKLSVSALYPRILDGADENTAQADFLVSDTQQGSTRGILPAFITGSDTELAAKRGIATHMLLQFCDLENLREGGVRAELERLADKSFISREDAERVRIDEVEMFASSELLSDMLRARRLYREFRFNVKLPSELFATEPEAVQLYRGTEVLVQGVIDCLIERADGEYCLVDYKTDRLTRAELADRELARARLSAAHGSQLSYYALAVERIFGKKPCEILIYSLHLGDAVRLDPVAREE